MSLAHMPLAGDQPRKKCVKLSLVDIFILDKLFSSLIFHTMRDSLLKDNITSDFTARI